MAQKLNVAQLLEKVVSIGASDLHLSVGVSPVIRINTALSSLPEISPLVVEDIEFFLSQILTQDQKDVLDVNKELDLSVALGDKVRFRVNIFYQKGYPSVAMRVIPLTVPQMDKLGLPPIIERLSDLRQGLVLVVGPTGHGKSTTIAAMIDHINATRAEHVITIEDPIEYIFPNKKSLIEQREMYLDTHSWEVALKAVLRQDPNVVFIGEMRDHESMSAALTISETGHLVFTTLHTNSAAQTIDRIIDSFPEHQQDQIRLQLSQVLEAVVSQRLVPSPTKGMVPAVEVLLSNTAVRSLIREGKSHQINNVINTNASRGMVTLDSSLAGLVKSGDIELKDALNVTNSQEELRRLLADN
ncbi:type IV pilus twitching motility protein PilT [candidate division WWE3 bacterium]|nr:type IV pilus twitching motility protein PilT [candidate division WWE3 bacterium]